MQQTGGGRERVGETVSGRVGATGAGLHFRGAADGDIGSEVTATARRWDHSGRRVSRVRLGRCEHSLVVILTIASRSNLRGEGTNCGERSCRVGSESGTNPLMRTSRRRFATETPSTAPGRRSNERETADASWMTSWATKGNEDGRGDSPSARCAAIWWLIVAGHVPSRFAGFVWLWRQWMAHRARRNWKISHGILVRVMSYLPLTSRLNFTHD